jgi:hypothetical protein
VKYFLPLRGLLPGVWRLCLVCGVVLTGFYPILGYSVGGAFKEKVQFVLSHMNVEDFREYQLMSLPEQIALLEKKLHLRPNHVSKAVLSQLIYEAVESVSSVPLQ